MRLRCEPLLIHLRYSLLASYNNYHKCNLNPRNTYVGTFFQKQNQLEEVVRPFHIKRPSLVSDRALTTPVTLHKKQSFSLRISPVNVTKFTVPY